MIAHRKRLEKGEAMVPVNIQDMLVD